jgi:Ca2+-binding EF-hand superfamily protein
LADQAKRQAIKDTLPIIFSAIDVDHDGGITGKEFANYFKSLGLTDDAFASSVFAAMDFNSDGELSNEGRKRKIENSEF